MGTAKTPNPPPLARPQDPIDLTESVAGEEDPGASIDLTGTPADTSRPARPTPSAGKDRPGGD